MDNIVLYTLIAFLVVLLFFLYLYRVYYELSEKVSEKPDVVINKTLNEETVIINEEETRRHKRKYENKAQPGDYTFNAADANPIIAQPGSASLPAAGSLPASASLPKAGSLPASASLPAAVGAGLIAAGFEDYSMDGSPAPAPGITKITEFDLAPTITVKEEPEPPTISGLLQNDLNALRGNLNQFFKTSEVSRQKKQGPPLIKPRPEPLPEIKHLYGDGSYDDIDNVHVYKSN